MVQRLPLEFAVMDVFTGAVCKERVEMDQPVQ